jgi:hypothetical protein
MPSPPDDRQQLTWTAKAVAKLPDSGLDDLIRDEIRSFATTKTFTDADTLVDIGYEHEDFMLLAKSLRVLLKHLQAPGTINTSDLEDDGVTVGDTLTLFHKALES